MVSRRTFLGTATATAAATGAALGSGVVGAATDSSTSELFQHGVASGDPLGDRVILWTRVTGSDNSPVPGALGYCQRS